MGILADKLKEKRYPAAEARLVILATEALRIAGDNRVVAAAALNKKLQDEFWVLKDLFLLPALEQVARDMTGKQLSGESAEDHTSVADKASIQPPAAAPSPAQIYALTEAKRIAAQRRIVQVENIRWIGLGRCTSLRAARLYS